MNVLDFTQHGKVLNLDKVKKALAEYRETGRLYLGDGDTKFILTIDEIHITAWQSMNVFHSDRGEEWNTYEGIPLRVINEKSAP